MSPDFSIAKNRDAPLKPSLIGFALEKEARHAMRLVENKFSTEVSDADRLHVWRSHFQQLYRKTPNYQFQDFEIEDYDLFALENNHRLFRGPKPDENDLERGNYICLIGAAQFFGRFQGRPLHKLIHEAFGIPVLNLSMGGVGPAEFLAPKLLSYLQRARLVVAQVLSGRSVGCEEFPGGMITLFRGRRTHREEALRTVLSESRTEYERLVAKWAENYCELYRQLTARLPGPKLLVWMSERLPEDWNVNKGAETGAFGRFPQLVTREMVDRIVPLFDAYIETVEPAQSPQAFSSRFTGKPCPFVGIDSRLQWHSNYYPQKHLHDRCFRMIQADISRLIVTGMPVLDQ